MGARVVTARQWDILFQAISEGKSVKTAAQLARVCREHVFAKRANDPDFRARFEAAYEKSTEGLEEEAFRRAMEGVKRPIVSHGKIVGWALEPSDALMALLLRARKPAVYADKAVAEVRHTIGWTPLTEDEWLAKYGPKGTETILSGDGETPLLPPPTEDDPHERLRRQDEEIARLKARISELTAENKSVKAVARIVDAREEPASPTMAAGSCKL